MASDTASSVVGGLANRTKDLILPVAIIAILLIGYFSVMANSDEEIFVDAEFVELRDIIH